MTLEFGNADYTPTIGALESGIGGGKSTLATSIGSCLEAIVFYEPTENNPYLKDFYNVVNPPGWRGRIQEAVEQAITSNLNGSTNSSQIVADVMEALDGLGATHSRIPAIMQLFLLTRRFDLYMAALSSRRFGFRVAILDRALHGDTVFARMLNRARVEETGRDLIDDRDMLTYWGVWEMIKHLTPKIHFFVRLHVSAKELLRRIEKRARGAEHGITLAYLEALLRGYDSFFNDIKHEYTIIDIDYEKPREVFDARQFPDFYKNLQNEPDEKYRRVLHPDEAAELTEFIMSRVPRFRWNDRMKAHPVEMAQESKTADFRRVT